MNTHTANPTRSPQAPVSLLRRIAEDHEFRARLEADPVSAFAEVGVHIDPAIVPDEVRLAVGGSTDVPDDLLDRKDRDTWRGLLG